MTMPRREEKPVFQELAEAFETLPLRAGTLTAATLALIGWTLPWFFPSTGLNLDGSLAIAGRYLIWALAFMILVSASVGAARRWIDGRRFDSDVLLADLGWSQFEGYLAEYFRRRGASVTYRGGAAPDGGVDLVLDDASGRRIVQAKHWKTRRVGVVHLRALWGVLDDERAQGAVFVTSGTFTPEARAFASGKRLELIDGDDLRRLISEVKRATPQLALEPAVVASESAGCPQCGRGVLQRRLARRGKNAGRYFLGCSQYPECHYTRDV
jgi:restriction system protein